MELWIRCGVVVPVFCLHVEATVFLVLVSLSFLFLFFKKTIFYL